MAELEGQAEQLAADLHAGQLTLRDILAQLTRPGRDPREDLPPPIFKQGILKLDDLQPGMELMGSVLNVVDFGAFVDIGLHDSGLVHVSQLANRFVRDPHEVVSVGDIVKVWVMEIDKTRRRVSLTMIAPGTPRHEAALHPVQGEGRRQRPERPRRDRPPRQRAAQPAGATDGNATNQIAAQGAGGAGETTQGAGATGGAPQRREIRGPHMGRKPRGRQRGKPGGGQHHHYQPKSKPKPLIPITKEMQEGKEPLRTFSDLMQFYKVQDEPETVKSEAGGSDASAERQEPDAQ